MTDETTAPDEVEAPPDEGSHAPETLAERIRAFKTRATQLAHGYGDRAGHCATFDGVLRRIGLPGRPNFERDQAEYGSGSRTLDDLEIEETEEQFDRWLRRSSEVLHDQVHSYGLGDRALAVIREIGFPTKVTRRVRIQGTFDVPWTVETWEGEPLASGFTEYGVRTRISDYFHTPDVTWKVVVDDPETPPEDAPAD